MPAPAGARTAGTPASRGRTAAILAAFAIVYTLLHVYAYTQKSSTFDEPLHLAAGYAALAAGDHRVDPTHPPFMRMAAALPLAIRSRPTIDLDAIDRTDPRIWPQKSYEFSHTFLYVDNDADRLLYPARFMIVMCGVLLGVLLFVWARHWLGTVPAIWVLAVYGLEPNLSAHASLVTTDLGATCFMYGAVYFLWRACRRRAPLDTIGLVAFTALAVVSKFSGLLLAPILAALLIVSVALGAMTVRRASALAGLLVLSTYVAIWAVYGFRYSPGQSAAWLFHLEKTTMVASSFGAPAAVASWIDDHHLLPNAFTQGFLLSQASARMLPSFLAGDLSAGGWWYYFPLAVAIKTPLAMLALLASGLFALAARRRAAESLDLAFALIPVLVFGAFAMASGINLGLRHVLPIYPFLLLIAAAAVREVATARHPALRVAVAALTVLWLTEFAAAYPHTLTFFNRLAGGPRNGSHYLTDSNVDWGQDLKPLKRWMDRKGVSHINLAYFGSADPAYYGIDCTHLPGAPIFARHAIAKPRLPGYVAVSSTVLSGVYLPPRWRLHYRPLLERQPEAWIGNSIRVYWLDRWPDAAEGQSAAAPVEPGTLRRLADSLLKQQWHTRAARYYRRYLRLSSQDDAALGNLGVALMADGRREEALGAFRRAADLRPADPRAQRNLALALLQTGRTAEAVTSAQRALALAPDDPIVRELLSSALAAQSQPRLPDGSDAGRPPKNVHTPGDFDNPRTLNP